MSKDDTAAAIWAEEVQGLKFLLETAEQRIKRLEFLLKSAEVAAESHLQARLRAEEALQQLTRTQTQAELKLQVDQLREQLHCCGQLALDVDPQQVSLREGDYGWSPAYHQVQNLQRLYRGALRGRGDDRVESQRAAAAALFEATPEEFGEAAVAAEAVSGEKLG